MDGKKAVEGFHPKCDAFGIIKAVDPNDHEATGETFHDVTHEERLRRAPSQPTELRCLDANRENADSDRPL